MKATATQTETTYTATMNFNTLLKIMRGMLGSVDSFKAKCLDAKCTDPIMQESVAEIRIWDMLQSMGIEDYPLSAKLAEAYLAG